MYLAIDIGGTKTLVGAVDEQGVIQQTEKFDTPLAYDDFLEQLGSTLTAFAPASWQGAGVGVPAIVNYEDGSVTKPANLPWQDCAVRDNVAKLAGCPVAIENDANLAGLSEAMLVKDRYNKVFYLTISTGIGGCLVSGQQIDRNLANSEPGHMFVEHEGELKRWETFASGRAIYQQYGQLARDIYDIDAWRSIARNVGVGLLVVEALLQPDVIILGGSIGSHFERYAEYLQPFLEEHASAQVPARPIMQAQRPEEAVLYGCYDFAIQQLS